MSAYYSTLSGWMIPLQRTYEATGLDFEAVKKQCGITYASGAHLQSRIPLSAITKLLHYGNDGLPSNDFIIKMTQFFHPSVFHSLGYAILSSSTLYDALDRVVKYNEAVSNSNYLTLTNDNEKIRLKMQVFKFEDTGRPVFDSIAIEAYFAMIVHIARQILGPCWSPTNVYFEYSHPNTNLNALTSFFGCPVTFSNAANQICFNSSDAHQSSISGDTEMALVHEKMFNIFLSRVSKASICQSIDNFIREKLPQGTPNQHEAAASIGLSLRSLQRKLQSNGTSYKDLLDNMRRKLTLEYLQQPHLSITEISYMVGFSNVGNFNRAFKRWTGATPTQYRSPKIVSQ